jgi:methionine-R-sulfoxide reductase
MKSWLKASTLIGGTLLMVACNQPFAVNSADATKKDPMNTARVVVRLLRPDGQLSEPVSTAKVVKTDAEWRRQLNDEQYRVTRQQATEPALCGVFYDHKKAGIYYCVGCDLPLFGSSAKFDSGTGWPSFFAPITPENVVTRRDVSHDMVRTEILCARCDAHLGHVFEDGPRPSGLRYCLNSASLVFREQKAKPSQ